MTTECIHGLELARCDACSPRTPPPAPARPARTPVQRKASSISSSRPITVDSGDRRIFHLTHRRNLGGILAAGRLLADTAGAEPVVDISAPDNRELRRAVNTGAAPVASFVPFFLAPDAILWDGMRSGEVDHRLAQEVRGVAASEFVLLVSSARSGGDGALVADGDAADPGTRFGPLAELSRRMSRRPSTGQYGDEEDLLRSAEFLVPAEFPVSALTLVGVANDKVRSEVRTLLSEHGFAQKVSVYPPWFQRP